MHSERRGQPHSNHIDWKIAALDGLGLILFFVPGVVAFAVDFYTGAIYLPLDEAYPGYGTSPKAPLTESPHEARPGPSTASGLGSSSPPGSGQQTRTTWQGLGLKRVVIPREQLHAQRIEQIATDHVGHEVALDDVQSRLSMLTGVEQFDDQLRRHRSNGNFGLSVRSFFSQRTQT